MTASTVYEAQRALEQERYGYSRLFDQVWYDLPENKRDIVTVENHPELRAAKAVMNELEERVARLQAQIGGKVYRVVVDKLDALQEKVAKIAKRAAKLELDPPTVTVTDEREWEEIRRVKPGVTQEEADILGEMVTQTDAIEFVYIVIAGNEPKLAGWTFIASLDHEEAGTVIRRIPGDTWLLRHRELRNELSEAQAVEYVEGIDLDWYRNAPNKCDHCGYIRDRKATFIVVNENDGRIMQVGSSCIKDFLGGNDPHRVASYAEYLMELDAALDSEDEEGFASTAGVERRVPVREFLTHVVTMIRLDGYRKSAWENSTKDSASNNLWNYSARKKNRDGSSAYVEPTDEDVAKADTVLDYLRGELAAQERKSEFEHNMVTYTASDYIASKSYGFVSFAPEMYDRDVEGKVREQKKVQRAEETEYVGTVGDRIKITARVEMVKSLGESDYGGTTYLHKLHDAEGHNFLWYGSYPLEQGASYSMTVTIKGHDLDKYTGAKTTKFNRPSKLTKVGDIEAAVPEVKAVVVKPAAEREAEREARVAKKEAEVAFRESITADERASFIKFLDEGGTGTIISHVKWLRRGQEVLA